MLYRSISLTRIQPTFLKERQLVNLLTRKAQKSLKLRHYDRATALSNTSLKILKRGWASSGWDVVRAENILTYANALLEKEPIDTPSVVFDGDFYELPNRNYVESEWIRFVNSVCTYKDRIRIISKPLDRPDVGLLQLDHTIESLLGRYSAYSIKTLPKLLTLRALFTDDNAEKCGFSIMALLMDINAEFRAKAIDVAIHSLYTLGHDNYKVLSTFKRLSEG